MTDIFETPRANRWRNMELKLTAAQINMASALWKNGHGTDVIAMSLGLGPEDECRVYNSLDRIKRKP